MPYIDHNMASSMSDDPSTSMASKQGKVIRTVPANSCSKSNKQPDEPPDEAVTSKYKVDLDLRKLMFMRNLLKAEVSETLLLMALAVKLT